MKKRAKRTRQTKRRVKQVPANKYADEDLEYLVVQAIAYQGQREGSDYDEGVRFVRDAADAVSRRLGERARTYSRPVLAFNASEPARELTEAIHQGATAIESALEEVTAILIDRLPRPYVPLAADRTTPVGEERFEDLDQLRRAVESLRMGAIFEEHRATRDIDTHPQAANHFLLAMNALEQATFQLKLAHVYRGRGL